MNCKILVITLFLFTLAGTVVLADNPTSTAALIEQLKQQIANLNTQIVQLQEQMKAIKQTSLQLKSQLKQGMSSDDVKLLQEFLATDPDIYPEGKITGYFGSLTRKAVERFQKKSCISSVGVVGPTTLWRINELLTEGAGNSGHIPPGLLKAPGIQKKLCATSTPATTTPDTIAPVISAVSATSTTSSTSRIIWTTDELSDSKVYYSTITPVDPVATSTSNMTNTTLVTSHDVALTGLNSATTYYYFVTSKDSAGNKATSSASSLTTLP